MRRLLPLACLPRTDTTAQAEATATRAVSQLAFRMLIAAPYTCNGALRQVFAFDSVVPGED